MTIRLKDQAPPLQAPPLHDDRFDEPDIVRAGTQTFARLRALVARGYQPEFDKSDDGCLLLMHPRKRFKYRDILIDSSGTVQWLHDQDYTMHFSRWEKKRFDSFLRSVPPPTWWDRTQVYRENIVCFVIGATLCVVLYTLASTVMSLAGDFFRGS
jgi:hypothetical protein